MEPNSIIEQIAQFRELTLNGKIDWTLPQVSNPALIKWDRNVGGKIYAVTIQKQPLPAQPRPINPPPGTATPGVSYFYFLTIVRLTPQPQQVVMQLNSQIEAQYKDALESLYTAALDHSKQKLGSIFNDLLKDL